MKENYYLDDGTYSASQIVIVMVKRHLEGLGKDIYGSLLADLNEPVESSEFRLKLKVCPCYSQHKAAACVGLVLMDIVISCLVACWPT